MRWFRLDYSDCTAVQNRVWAMEDAGELPRSPFHISAHGRDASTATPDPIGEQLFRMICVARSIQVEEGDTQQVVTFLDLHFSSIGRWRIIVNGTPKIVTDDRISYEQLAQLAFAQPNPEVLYTIVYDHGPASKPEGSVLKGEVVEVANGMIFDVANTGSA